MAAEVRCLVVGNSHVRRLREFMWDPREYLVKHGFAHKVKPSYSGCDLNFGLPRGSVKVRWYARGGAYVQTLSSDSLFVHVLNRFQPHVVVMQLGGNDLCIQRKDASGRVLPLEAQAFSVGEEVFQFAEWLQLAFGVQQIRVCEVLHRTRVSKWVSCLGEYNAKVDSFNHYLSTTLPEDKGFSLWTHTSALTDNLDENVSKNDGVHMTPHPGQEKLFRSVRGAVIDGVKTHIRITMPGFW